MLGLLWMTNWMWEGVITPLLLVGFGWWVRPRVEHLERQAPRPYDWEIAGCHDPRHRCPAARRLHRAGRPHVPH